MKTIDAAPGSLLSSNEAGRRRLQSVPGDPLFIADWDRALMLHYEISPRKLQPWVPFELDLWHGMAHVSLVAFTMRGLRPRRGGRLSRALFAPVATHEFLNVRTYVTHESEAGIYFLTEWVPNVLSLPVARPLFGLPYRLAKLNLDHAHERGWIEGKIRARFASGELNYHASVGEPFAESKPGSLTEFLIERYSAFTCWRGWKRRFRVWHQPWQQCAVAAKIRENSLMATAGDWAGEARFIGANYSPGVKEVWMGRPMLVDDRRPLNLRTNSNMP